MHDWSRMATLCASALIFAVASFSAMAGGQTFKVPTRPDVKTTLFWEAKEAAKATVLLFPGGGGGFGKVESGKPTSNNFLVRSVPYFLENGFNVAVFGRPSDSEELAYADRISENHLTDVRAVLEFIKQQSPAPIWIIGTSRGAISAAAAVINIQDHNIAGLGLTSAVVSSRKTGAVPQQDLAAIKVPVLVVHHTKDACSICQPQEVPAILHGLTNSPTKKEIDSGLVLGA